MSETNYKSILEAALLAAGKPLSVDNLMELFVEDNQLPERSELRAIISELQSDWEDRGLELVQVASGYRFQVRQQYATWMRRLWMERPARYSRALLETLAIIAYRQPVTRGEIEEIRGVGVSPTIIKTLSEREWIRELGHREVPGRPAIFGTTRKFLDHFNLRSLESLPPLSEIRDLERIHPDLFGAFDVSHGAPRRTDDEVEDGDLPPLAMLPDADEPSTAVAIEPPLNVQPPDGATH